MEDKKSYYECKRCFYICYQKNTMKKHLEKVKTCDRKLDSYKYKDDELYDLSLIRINSKNKNTQCEICNKILINVFSLKRHKNKYHNDNIINDDIINDDIINDNIINDDIINDDIINDDIIKDDKNIINNYKNCNILNGNINNTFNIINNNVSINILNFDDNWNTSHIDDKQKILLLLKKYKFTTTLENILENEVNLNVLIDNTTENALVCNNDKFENMDVKDIVKKTMKKLVDSLNNFKNEISEKNNHELDLDILDTEIKKANIKYNEYKKDKIAQNDVNNMIKNIYNKKRDDTYINCKNYGY